MANESLINAIKAGDAAASELFAASAADINETDEQGWTPLNYAAGSGDLPLVRLLLERGADVFQVGRDNRTAYMIALAAGRVEVAEYLREIENQTDPERAKALRTERKYCKAYYLRKLRRFPGWSESRVNGNDNNSNNVSADSSDSLPDDKIVFIHQDYTVTESIWPGEKVVFDGDGAEWRDFCREVLAFRVPDDLELAAAAASAQGQ